MTLRTPMDALIDDVAARLTAGDPAPHLRERVLAGIDRTPARPKRVLVAAGLVAAASLAFAVAARLAVPASIELPSLAAAPNPAVARLAAGPYPVRAVIVPLPGTPASARPAAPALSEAEQAWTRRAIPALTERATLTLDGIQPDPLGAPLLEVRPLATSPIAVAPIDGGGPTSRGRHD